MNISVQDLVDILIPICGERYVLTDTDILYGYGMDSTLNIHSPFDILVKPGSATEIAAIVNICNKYNIPITPRGGGSGVTGGTIPVNRGVVLSLERLNRIITFNKLDRYVVAESGVITADLCRFVEQEGLFFPVSPTSSSYSFIGGNVAVNAGSMNSCKYGTTAQYVLNLEVVLPTGDIIWTGANVQKNATGLNLTKLLIGSEGILGIITKVVYRLLPIPRRTVLLLAGFETLHGAYNAITDIRKSFLIPSAVELICRDAIKLTSDHLKVPLPLVKEDIGYHLLVEMEYEEGSLLINPLEMMATILSEYSQEDVLVARELHEKEKLWRLRLGIGDAMGNSRKIYRDVDISVPLSFLHRYIMKVEEVCQKHKISGICFGHALDGNLHTMLGLNKNAGVEEKDEFRKATTSVYEYAISNGGVISGEHGIGLLQKDLMPLQFTETHMQLMQKIKRVFDPNGILNTGKVF